jgi:hypothetical protein
MLKKLFFSLTAVIALSLVVMAQDKSVTLTGHIVDKACSAREAKKDAPGAAHTKGCSLMENCAKSGFGVFADGKWTEFDEKGNGLAKAALEKSKKDKGAKFKVVGKVAGDKMTVESISEVE